MYHIQLRSAFIGMICCAYAAAHCTDMMNRVASSPDILRLSCIASPFGTSTSSPQTPFYPRPSPRTSRPASPYLHLRAWGPGGLLRAFAIATLSSRTGRPQAFGSTSTGKHITVIWDEGADDPRTIYPVTAGISIQLSRPSFATLPAVRGYRSCSIIATPA